MKSRKENNFAKKIKIWLSSRTLSELQEPEITVNRSLSASNL